MLKQRRMNKGFCEGGMKCLIARPDIDAVLLDNNFYREFTVDPVLTIQVQTRTPPKTQGNEVITMLVANRKFFMEAA